METNSRFKQWFQSRKVQRRLVIITFMAVPLLLLFVFTYLPFGEMIDFSFYKMKYTGKRTWVGLQNYIDVFKRDDCFGALKLCIYYIVGAVVQLALALYFATILSFKVRGGNFFKGVLFFPYLINGIAIGFIFRFFYTRGFVLDTVLQWCGFELEKLPFWLRDTRVNNISLVATSVWRYLGQNMVLFIGAIMSVDSELYEASVLDGATKFQQFRYIILPSIKNIVLLNLILAVSGSLSAFEPAYVITKGSNGTATYFVFMDELAHVTQKVGLASAMAVVLLGMILLITLIQKLLFKYVFRNIEDEDVRAEKIRQRRVIRYERKKRREALKNGGAQA